jgi:hypothetical protein
MGNIWYGTCYGELSVELNLRQSGRVFLSVHGNLSPRTPNSRSRIHERTILLRFMGIIMRVLRLEVSIYNDYIINQFQTTFGWDGGGGVKSVDCEQQGGKLL